MAIEDEISGVGGASGMAIGRKLDDLGLESFTASLNFGSWTYSQNLPTGDVDIFGKLKTTTFGMHLRYDVFPRHGPSYLSWGGLSAHFGYEYNRNVLEFETTLDEPLDLDTGLGVLAGRIVGSPHYEIETTSHSFPFELSTSVNLLYLLNFYIGLGADYHSTRVKGRGKLQSNVTALACTSGFCLPLAALPEVVVSANLDETTSFNEMVFRAFGGFQLEGPFGVKIFGQVSEVLGTEVTGLAAGVRLTF